MAKQESGTEMALREAASEEFQRRTLAEYACWVHGLVPMLKKTREELATLYPDKRSK